MFLFKCFRKNVVICKVQVLIKLITLNDSSINTKRNICTKTYTKCVKKYVCKITVDRYLGKEEVLRAVTLDVIEVAYSTAFCREMNT